MPTIGLCMIVKNEAAIIRRCLESTRRLVDYVLVVDTGSSDATKDVICAFLKAADIPGKVVEEPWHDFATNRTSALAKLREVAGIDYALIMDADDQVIYHQDFDPARFKRTLQLDMYDVVLRIEQTSYPRPLVCRNAIGFRFRGVVHEFLEGPANSSKGFIADFHVAEAREGARSQNPLKYQQDAALLEQAIETERDPFLLARYHFFLAQSYRDAGDREKALAIYLRHADMGLWDQEVFMSLWNVAQLKEKLEYPDDDIISSYIRAHNACPSRAESLFDAMRFCRTRGRVQEAFSIGKRAVTVPKPASASGLLVQPWIYDYALFDEFATAAFLCGHYEDALRYLRRMLAEGHLPDERRAKIQVNAQVVQASILSLRSQASEVERMAIPNRMVRRQTKRLRKRPPI